MAVAEHEIGTTPLAGLDLAAAGLGSARTAVTAAGPFGLLRPLGITVGGIDRGVPHRVRPAVGQADHVGGSFDHRLHRLDVPGLGASADITPESLVRLGELGHAAPVVVPVGETGARREHQRLARLHIVGPEILRTLGRAVPDHQVRRAIRQQALGIDDPPLGHEVMPRVPVVILHILHECQTDLTQVAHASGLVGPRFGLGEGRQEHPGEDGDDGDHHQEFDQRERGTGTSRTDHGSFGDSPDGSNRFAGVNRG